MLRTSRRARRPRSARRGAVLLVVLSLLALFAVVGLGFVLYAESEATGARNYRSSRNEIADPDPELAASQFLATLLFDTNDTTSPLWGHSLARSRFGPFASQASPFTGAGFPFGTNVTLGAATLDQTQVVNYGATGGTVNPDNWNKAVPWTYPDRNNFYLAYYDPVTDRVTVPSFHRPDLGNWIPGDPNNFETQPGGRFKTLRPRRVEHPNFPSMPANADGSYSGDVRNLMWVAGGNDSIWLDIGLPAKEWRGRRYKMLVAPLILDLGGKVNLSVAGNNRNGGGHGSNQGWGPWEVNPTGLLTGGAGDLTNLLNLRYNAASSPPGLDRFRLASTGTLNGGRMTPQYSRIDAVGVSTGGPDAMVLPAVNGSYPFPSFNTGVGNTSRFAQSQSGPSLPTLDAQLAVNPPNAHGQSFSPWQWPRARTAANNTAWVPSLEDQLRLALPSRMTKNTPTGYNGQFTPNSRLTTLFSVSQRWGEMTVPINNTGGTARIAAIDLTRPLPDYRTNPAVPLSPVNMGNATAALLARQNLARDIFVRLLAGLNQIDGTNVVYDPTTANVVIGYAAGSAPFNGLRAFAQYAVNMVDNLDNDDINTPFVWNTAVATDIVFGTELPKLVLNEVYSQLQNGRNDVTNPPPMMNATEAQRVMFWVELHNPLPRDPSFAAPGMEPLDPHTARLQYETNVTSVVDPTTGNPVPYTGVTYPVYQIDIAEVRAATADKTPLATALAADPNVALDIVATPLTGATTRLRVQTYTYATTAPTTAAVLAADQLNVVLPANGAATGADGGNAGYYVIGARDDFPGRRTTMRLEDVGAGGPQDAMQYAVGNNPLDKAGLTTRAQSRHTVILRRLANPYLPAGATNPYVIVDYLENLPLRDRAKYATDSMNVARPEETGPTVGRRHPYAAAPTYGAANPAVVDQVPAPLLGVNPENTFFGANQPLDNAAGLAWLAHLDRQPVNVLELLATGVQSPAKLTQTFYNGTLNQYQQHLTLTPATGIPFPLDPAFGGFVRVLDLLGVSSGLPGIPLGGREPGRVNLNTAGDAAVLSAVLDPQSGNLFPAAYPAAAWNNAGTGLLPSRTPTNSSMGGSFNQPAATVAEGGSDRPFQPAGALFTDSLFRQGTTPNLPALFNYGAGTNGHPSMISEPLRKGWNNLTTVSDGFLVVFTVAPFEWNGTQLGRELYDKVNGDLRAQFAGVIDRTAITQNLDTTLAVQTTTLGPKPWETKLTADANPLVPAPANSQITIQAFGTVGSATCTVYDDGTPVTIDATGAAATATRTSVLWVGYSSVANGGDGEGVRVSGVTVNGNGTATLTLAAPLTRFHGGGTRVSNAPIGHPGPQTQFDYREPTGKYRGVLPYFMRIVP